MAIIKNSSEALEFPLHLEGEGFNFTITDVIVDETNQEKDFLIFTLAPERYDKGRYDLKVWVWNDPGSFILKKFCEACQMDPKGGFDSVLFVGKIVTCDIEHNKSRDGKRIYANIVAKSLKPYRGRLDKDDKDDENVPF